MDNVYQYAVGVVLVTVGVALVVAGVRRWLRERPRSEVAKIVWRASPARVVMAELEVRSGLAVSAGHPVFRAVLAVLDEKIALASVQVSDPNLLKTEAGALPVVHTAGGLEWLRDVREELESVRAAGERAQAEAEAEGRR